LGKVWCTVCPWLAVADWIQKLTFWRKRDKSLSLNLKWPVKLRNIWLAIFFFVFLTWIEIGHDITISPRGTAYLAVAMFVLTIGSGLIFERNSFCRYGCFVGRISGMYALFSPVELRSKDKEVCKTCRTKDCIRGNGKGYPCPTFEYPGTMDLNTYCILCTECIKTCPHENITVRMRPFAADLYKSMRGSADEAYMCLALFGLTFLHTITMTPPWFNLMERLQIMTGWGYVELFTILMAILALSPVSIHYGFSWVSRRFSGRLDIPKKTVFINFAYALLPVCLFFHMGHNVEHLFLEGQYVIPAVSDPFGWQWDLFGTADWTVNPTLSVTTTLYIQFALVLIGLIFGLLIAYKVAFRTFSRVGAIKGFIPMAFLLVVFTLINGWLLAKPMISRLGL
ncbi:MAG: 4Fe-4S binding protein, partial [bacterium]